MGLSAGGRPLPAALEPLRADPSRSAVLCDFDGTLAPIVPDPETAAPLAGAPVVLGALCRRFAVVAVVSGRPASFLARHLGDVHGLRLYGGYGAEWICDGEFGSAPEMERWTPKVAGALAAAQAQAPPGLGIEDKGYALALHWRRAPETGPWATRFAEDWAGRTGLVLQPGRRVVELRPPDGPDKGTVVERSAGGCRAACFAGDDAGDLAAFDALDRLSGRGVTAVRVAVSDEESPSQLLARADVVVQGPAEALELLGALAAAG